MILSAGLTPAWQQILVFDQLRLGQVNRAAEVHWCASGKVFNAGVGAHRLGGPSLTLAPVGGLIRREIEREMDELGVPCQWVVTESATRICTTLVERATGTITELVEEGRPLSSGELDAFRAAYAEDAAKADVVVLIGSLPTGVPASFYRDLVQSTPCPAVLDFRGEGLLGVLDLKPLVVKPNREELAQTVGRAIATDEELLAAMRTLNERGAPWVVVSQGAAPAWATSASKVYRFHAPPVERIVNPIGSGDAMAAAMAWAIRAGRSMPECIQWGIGAAAENLGTLLPCRLEPWRVAELAGQVRIEEG